MPGPGRSGRSLGAQQCGCEQHRGAAGEGEGASASSQACLGIRGYVTGTILPAASTCAETMPCFEFAPSMLSTKGAPRAASYRLLLPEPAEQGDPFVLAVSDSVPCGVFLPSVVVIQSRLQRRVV